MRQRLAAGLLVDDGAAVEFGALVSKPAVCLNLGGERGDCRY